MKRNIIVFLFTLVLSVSAYAWPSCSGNWVQVPKGTPNNPGAGGIGSVVTEGGQTFQCQKAASSTPTSVATATGNGGAGGAGGAGGKGGKSVSISKGGNQGQNQEQKQNQDQNQDQSLDSTNQNALNATGNGSNSNNTTVYGTKMPVATAYSPTAIPTMNCFKGFGAGAQTSSFGISFGGGKVDDGCEILEVARSFALAGRWEAYCQMMISNKYAKKAGVTFEQCMKTQIEVFVANNPPAQPTPTPIPTPVVKEEPYIPINQDFPTPSFFVEPKEELTNTVYNKNVKRLIGICTFTEKGVHTCQVSKGVVTQNSSSYSSGTKVSSICEDMLNAAILEINNNPNEYLIIKGNHNSSEPASLGNARAWQVIDYLNARIDKSHVVFQNGNSGTRTVEIWVGPEFTVANP